MQILHSSTISSKPAYAIEQNESEVTKQTVPQISCMEEPILNYKSSKDTKYDHVWSILVYNNASISSGITFGDTFNKWRLK